MNNVLKKFGTNLIWAPIINKIIGDNMEYTSKTSAIPRV